MPILIISLIFLFVGLPQIEAQNWKHIKIIDTQNEAVFGVYVVLKNKNILLTSSDIDGKCMVNTSHLQSADSLQFQGMGYKLASYCVKDLKDTTLIRLQELGVNLKEAVVKGYTPEEILNIASSKLKKERVRRIPLCYYHGPARYEKITWCRDSAIEYRREYGHYFYSGDVIPKNTWDETHRSYLVPEYRAQSYSLTVDGSDTIPPIYLTSDNIRFDVGTRKVFTLMRAVQLYAPLFSNIKQYDINPINTDSLDYMFSFKTKTKAYPNQTRITCKGTLTIDWQRLELKQIDFDYIDYQLLRQILLTDKRNTSSPFSTRAALTFAYDSTGRNYIRSCKQTTTWKYDLNPNFILIEQPSRIHPGPNKLVEEEAFYCYSLERIPEKLQDARTLARIHMAHRFPKGLYEPNIFNKFSPLLDDRQAKEDVGKYMDLEKQFQKHDGKTFYSENYIMESLSDKQSLMTYRDDLYEIRKSLFESFGHCPFPDDL